MVRRNWFWTLGVPLMLMTALLVQGCGLKADPAPRRIQSLPPATEIRLQHAAGGIIKYNAMTHRASVGADGFLGII